MIAAFLADIHGNGLALDAVLGDLPAVDALICVGDLVGYYPDAGEVVDRLRDRGALAIRGNHELMVCGSRSVAPEVSERCAVEWTRRALSEEQLAWLANLPEALQCSWDALKITVRHASPWDEDSYLYPDSPRLRDIHLPDDCWLVLGHTHYPFQRQCGNGWVVNPGFVGQPRDWDPRAAYALLDTASRTWQQRRVAYDHRAYQQRLQELAWDPEITELLGRTRGRRHQGDRQHEVQGQS